MKKRYWISIVTTSAIVLASCQSNPPKQAPIVAPSPQAFPQPLVPAVNKTLPPIKIPGMIQPTDSRKPLATIAVSSTRDPFAAVATPPQLKAAIQPPAQSPGPAPSAPPEVTPPELSFQAPVLPEPIASQASGIAALPPTPPTTPTPQIEITGIVQAGGKQSAIVREADGGSRYVQVGDTLANGQIKIKQINVNPNREPTIVLHQNGVDITRTVGSGAVF